MTKASKVKAQEYTDPIAQEAEAIEGTEEVAETKRVQKESRKGEVEAAKDQAEAQREARKEARKGAKWEAGKPAPTSLYQDADGEITDEPPGTGTLVVAEGAVVTAAVLEQIKG